MSTAVAKSTCREPQVPFLLQPKEQGTPRILGTSQFSRNASPCESREGMSGTAQAAELEQSGTFANLTTSTAAPAARPVHARGLVAIMLFTILALVPALTSCAARHPRTVPPLSFRHCTVTSELPGFIGCDCLKPLIVWDAQIKRKIVYCDGKAQQ